MSQRKRKGDGRRPMWAASRGPTISWMEKRVERLYRLEVVPRLEAKEAAGTIDEVGERVLARARLFLVEYDAQTERRDE